MVGMTRPTALGVLWILSALVVGGLGWLWFALTEEPDARIAGWLLLAVAVLGALTAVAILARGSSSRPLSLVTSGVFVVGGIAAAALAAMNGGSFLTDLLVLGGLPIVAGVATYLLSARVQR